QSALAPCDRQPDIGGFFFPPARNDDRRKLPSGRPPSHNQLRKIYPPTSVAGTSARSFSPPPAAPRGRFYHNPAPSPMGAPRWRARRGYRQASGCRLASPNRHPVWPCRSVLTVDESSSRRLVEDGVRNVAALSARSYALKKIAGPGIFAPSWKPG